MRDHGLNVLAAIIILPPSFCQPLAPDSRTGRPKNNVDSEIRVLSESEFHALSERVLGIAFDVHNDFGRLMDESVYQQAILKRAEAAGLIPAQREVAISVSHRSFRKRYFMDLLFASGLMVELKTVEKLNNLHYAQALHYLLLTGMHHGLLVNLRPGKVEKRFISTTLTLTERQRYRLVDSQWSAVNEASNRLRTVFLELLDDWGAFLQTALYREAIIHFFGGPETALQSIPIYDGEVEAGTHEVCLLSSDTAMALTSLKQGKDAMLDHLRRFLSHTRLTHLQWINMHNHDIQFFTISR